MILATAQDLGRQYSGDPVFQGLSFEIRAGDRIGLVGTNGAGKSTLLRLLAGTDRPDYGRLHLRPAVRVSLLEQEPQFAPDETLMDVARSGLASLIELRQELEEAAGEMAEAEDQDDLERATRRYQALKDQLEHRDAFSVDHRVEEILQGLGFPEEDFHRPARTFSGGQQSRLMLARLLLESPDLMLMDEPSNHLDIPTTEWLESYLSRQPVAQLIVSHDRYFLDTVVTRIWELHRGRLTVYPGNYSQYWRLRQERGKVLERQAERQDEEVADLKDFIARNAAGQKSKQAKDREKKLARIERIETISEIEGPPMAFGEVERCGDIAIESRGISKAYGKPLFHDLNLAIQRGQCVGILGPNGSGKTTLLKILIGCEKPDRGEVRLGHRVTIGYYDQGLEALPPDTSVVRAVWPEGDPAWVEQDTRDLLARFGLKGELVLQTVGQLSGGEKGKAALARLAATETNVLVMDEPTNHLDLWSRESLERAILAFEGTVLVVSHDRYFLDQVADRIIAVGSGEARIVEGGYEMYQRLLQRESEAAADSARKTTPPAPTPDSHASTGRRRKRKFPYRKPADLEREISTLESEFQSLEAALGESETYRDPQRARATHTRYEELKAMLQTLYEHWEEALELNS